MSHLTEDALIEQIYLGETPTHVTECEGCRNKFENLRSTHTDPRSQLEPSVAFLAQQRARIMEPVATPQRHWGWAPSFAAACLVVVAGVAYRNNVEPPKPIVELSDQQIVASAFAAAQVAGPQAAQPMQGLFDAGN